MIQNGITQTWNREIRQVETTTVDLGDPKLAELVRRLVDAVHPEQIYLFGSRARGDATKDSDYDVLVLFSQGKEDHLRDLQRVAYHALWGFGMPVDVVVMTREFYERRRRARASLPATVEREGRLVYAS
jgi:predicted nucleotidyltransferase